MLRSLLQKLHKDEGGFTLIELLVVNLIIGILAAIALPAFLNQREKAQDTEAKSAVRTAQTALETFYTDHQTYDGAENLAAGGGGIVDIEPSLKNAQALAVTVHTDQNFTVSVTSKGNNHNVFTIEKVGDVVHRTCTTAGKGGCKTPGTDGNGW
jgi:type IV pilus assembly protein PilA